MTDQRPGSSPIPPQVKTLDEFMGFLQEKGYEVPRRANFEPGSTPYVLFGLKVEPLDDPGMQYAVRVREKWAPIENMKPQGVIAYAAKRSVGESTRAYGERVLGALRRLRTRFVNWIT